MEEWSPEVTKENTFCIWNSITTRLRGILRALQRSQWSGPVFQTHLISCLTSLAHWAAATHSLSYPQTPSCLLLFQLLSFHSESTWVLCIFWSQLRRLWGIQAPFTYIFSTPSQSFIAFPQSLKSYLSPETGCILGDSGNTIFDYNTGSGWGIWDLAPTSSSAEKWVWLRERFHL